MSNDKRWRVSQDRDFIFIGLIVTVLGGFLAGVGTLIATDLWIPSILIGLASALLCAVIYFGNLDDEW